VGVDQEQRLAVPGVGGGDGHAVRSARFLATSDVEGGHFGERRLFVEGLERVHRNAFDVPADAALAEAQGHPRFEAGDGPRRHLGVGVEVEVQTVGPRVHEGAQPGRALGVQLLHLRFINEETLPQVLVDRRLAFGLGQPPDRVQVVGLDPVEVVLGLGVDHAEDSVGVGLRIDVGDAAIVADDGDAGRLLLESRQLRTRARSLRRRGRRRRGDEDEGQQKSLHDLDPTLRRPFRICANERVWISAMVRPVASISPRPMAPQFSARRK
jgi:hypothetical protein